jgi:hypothetical protein
MSHQQFYEQVQRQQEYEMNSFATLAAINVNDKTEKKNGLTYLSWAWAVDQLMRHDPMANWEFHAPVMFGETMMVSCTVTAFGKPITMHLPVMDHRNQAIKNPDAFQVNKNMMRCLVKAIACHGLGLYIYSGEDLPEGEKDEHEDEDAKLLAQYQEAAQDGIEALQAFHSVCKGPSKNRVWAKHGEALKSLAKAQRKVA